ncbi:MAG: hypothetical protein WA615_21160, partial [Bradyrhizobium sp.]|uniref:hypothetical protein n=1 Tax=Bradyrhizobium sp. TaxID=376 RepID=UPI003C7EA2E0
WLGIDQGELRSLLKKIATNAANNGNEEAKNANHENFGSELTADIHDLCAGRFRLEGGQELTCGRAIT